MKGLRKKSPGSDWLFFSIYSGTFTSEKILKELEYLIQSFESQDYLAKWFFIRYNLPSNHIRIRFQIKKPYDIAIGKIIVAVNEHLNGYLQSEEIFKTEINTYFREIERYALKDSMSHSESFFHISSKQALQIVNSTSESLRWKYCLKSIDGFLDQFNYSLDQKFSLLQQIKNGFDHEFNPNDSKHIRKQLSSKYRQLKTEISRQEVFEFLSFNSEYKALFEKSFYDYNRNYIDYLMESYIHMHCNRIFITNQRANEWVLYDLLYQDYRSKTARLKMGVS